MKFTQIQTFHRLIAVIYNDFSDKKNHYQDTDKENMYLKEEKYLFRVLIQVSKLTLYSTGTMQDKMTVLNIFWERFNICFHLLLNL